MTKSDEKRSSFFCYFSSVPVPVKCPVPRQPRPLSAFPTRECRPDLSAKQFLFVAEFCHKMLTYEYRKLLNIGISENIGTFDYRNIGIPVSVFFEYRYRISVSVFLGGAPSSVLFDHLYSLTCRN